MCFLVFKHLLNHLLAMLQKCKLLRMTRTQMVQLFHCKQEHVNGAFVKCLSSRTPELGGTSSSPGSGNRVMRNFLGQGVYSQMLRPAKPFIPPGLIKLVRGWWKASEYSNCYGHGLKRSISIHFGDTCGWHGKIRVIPYARMSMVLRWWYMTVRC